MLSESFYDIALKKIIARIISVFKIYEEAFSLFSLVNYKIKNKIYSFLLYIFIILL